DFRLWSGLEGGGVPTEQEHKFRVAELAYLDERVDQYYFDAKAVIESVEVMDDQQTERHKLLQALNHSLNLINWLRPGSEDFYETVYEAQTYLQQQLDSMESQHDVTFHCIGHTHIDVAWLWRLKHTREK